MTPRQARFAHLSSLLVGVSGIALFVLKDLVVIEGEFGPESHYLEDDVQAAHILTAPALVFACALIWQDHVWAKFQSGARARRRTGLLLLSLLAPMILSGYLLQVSYNEPWREIWRVTHLVSSLVWLVAYGVHQLTPKRSKA
ncbi:MAG: hypothetical protein MK297_07825 [Planctomycetes bacterium]|nr:hypothetical protein [Planctomycetota bacterium]